jgi:ribosomal protein S18 acetylase RimI-like enzyme
MENYRIKIYKATEENIDDMTCIYNDSINIFPSEVRKNSDRSLFYDIFNSNNVYIAERTDISKKIGWIAYKINQKHIFIVGLYFLHNEQRKGNGTKLLNYCFESIWKNNYKIITLNVLKNAPWSIEFYKRNGFTVFDQRNGCKNELEYIKTKDIKDWEIVMYKYISI